ncbi:MAG TPA: CehA/McbA family metallohydrolase [Acidimicrobiales bacterium]
MCCQDTEVLDLPPAVIEMLAHYRRLQAERSWDWGDDRIEMFRWARFSRLGDVFAAMAETGDWPAAVRSVVGDEVPAGVVVVALGPDGPSARTGPPRPVVAGRTTPIDVVVDSALDRAAVVEVAGEPVPVAAGGAAVRTVDVDGAAPGVTVRLLDGDGDADHDRTRDRDRERDRDGDHAAALRITGAVTVAEAATLRLRSPRCARWSVTDAAGGAWFPDGALPKWDVHHRPFFHADDVAVVVPAGALTVACTRGLEFERVERQVTLAAGEERAVAVDPGRLVDPAAAGWYGGDLHIHLNYSGDLVCSPADAARMQLGEGLHLANLVAGNCMTSLVYDRELLEATAGRDLPWSSGDVVARMGVEYRNDLLGHVHALGPAAPPGRYQSGHERSDHPEDWPPNTAACEELRHLGATVGYAHPAFRPFPDDWSTDPFFAAPRSVEARELVVDAALGLVDSVDLISPFDDDGAVFLYHRLLSCGLRLAATAGTDVFLSFSHGPGVASNPPGWGRVYAHLGDRPLGVEAFKDAVRAGRTLVTNGPWVTLDVDGHGPGAVVDAEAGTALRVTATVRGEGVEELALVGPDGVVARGDGSGPLAAAVAVGGATWIAAVARGPGGPATLDARALAHTTPVYVDVGGRRVARARDARWCLDLLDRVQHFVHEHGSFHEATRSDHLADHDAVIDRARSYYRGVLAAAGAA